jgi:hypothetical protein
MEIIIRRRDIYVVAAFLTCFFSWIAYAAYDNQSARQTLVALAESHIDEWFATEPVGTRREDYEYVAIVDMERPYELFGPAFGVVHVYIRNRGDVACETFKGIEYYYRHENGGWQMEHSAGCGAKEHHVRAFQEYLARGAGVEGKVIDRALGLEFDVARAEEYLKARQEGRNPFLASHANDHAAHENADQGGHEHGVDAVHQHDSDPNVVPESLDDDASGRPTAPARESINSVKYHTEVDSFLSSGRERIRARNANRNTETHANEGVAP